MTRTTLDPKVDVVFKLLFAKPSNMRLLMSLLMAILEFADCGRGGAKPGSHERIGDGERDGAGSAGEAPRWPPGQPRDAVRWGRFLAADNDEDLEQLAMSDPELREAKAALEELSQDPAARRLAEERRLAEWNYRTTMAREREEGREEGRNEALRDAVEHLFSSRVYPARALMTARCYL